MGSRKKQINYVILRASFAEDGIPWGEREYRFAPPRRWRFDIAWPEQKIAVEIEGGIWTKGRHIRPAGFLKDMEKYQTATLAGWMVLRYTPDTIFSQQARDEIAFALSCR